jgi:hypothetical protein
LIESLNSHMEIKGHNYCNIALKAILGGPYENLEARRNQVFL